MAAEDRQRLNWGGVDVNWDGEAFTLFIPAALHGWPASWLNRHLSDLVLQIGREISHAVRAEAMAATFQNGNVSAWGGIRVHPLREPFPDAARLREVIEQAVDDAYDAANIATESAREFTRQLRDRA